MKTHKLFLIFSGLFLWFGFSSVSAQLLKNQQYNYLEQNFFTTQVFPDTFSYAYHFQKPRPWLAAAEVVGFNAGLHLFDRFVLKADYAQVTPKVIRHNLKHGFVWDNDNLSTNMFWHPFTGALYFNSARTNGHNFWQSIPYAIFGSLIWECFGESEPPSLNDLIATPIGGIALGEITYRISHLVLDDSKQGLERFGRELLGGIISPMGLFNRMLNGDAWNYRPRTPYHFNSPYNHSPFIFNISAASRFLEDMDGNKGSMNMALCIEMIYGQPFINKNRKPYDFFTANIGMNVIGNQPLIYNVNVIGLIWGKEWKRNDNHWLAGVFQHFDFYDTDPIVAGGKRLYQFTETAAFGGGVLYKRHQENNRLSSFSGAVYANLILLGASETDYYFVDNRNYNLGNGYSVKLNGRLNIKKRWEILFGANHYHIFTTKGYGNADWEVNGLPEDVDFHYANVQGNKGNAFLSMINIGVGYQISKKMRISADQRFFLRKSHYEYLPDVRSSSMENHIQLTYTIFNR